MTVVDLKVTKRTKRSRPLDQATDASRFYNRVVRDIVADLDLPAAPLFCAISIGRWRWAKSPKSVCRILPPSARLCGASVVGWACRGASSS